MTAARARGGGALAAAAAVRVRIPFRHPFVTAAGTWHERDAWIVTLRDASGREGVGEASLDPGASRADLDALRSAIRATIADPAQWSGATGAADIAGARSAGSAVALAIRAAFSGAAADLERHHVPGPTGFVPVNATIATESLDETLEAVEAALDAGFDCIKLKGGREHTSEGLVERLALVRALAGDDIELRLDVNGAWERQIAAERLGAIAHLDVAYVEQPIPPGDLETLAWLRRVSPIDIAADESVGSPAEAEAVLAAGAADVLVVKPARVGGPRAAAAIAAAAAERDVAVTISTLVETGVGLAAAIRVAAELRGPDRRHAHGLATAGVLVDDLLATPLEVHDGRVRIPAEPLELDEAAVERWAVERVGGGR